VADPVQYFLDQHVHGAVPGGLRKYGVDVLTAQEAGRCGLSDADQLAFATAQERVVVTYDADYLALAAGGVTHAGVAFCDASRYRNRVGALIQMLVLLHGVSDRDAMKNRVEFL
jgi:hypothetical protein